MVEFVAEFTTNHFGHFGALLRMVEQAANAGATYIKMQKKDVESFYSKEKLDSKFESPFGNTYREYRTMFEFSVPEHYRFAAKCKEHNIKWFSTVQDIHSLEWMLEFDLPMYKVASCNSNNIDFLKELAQTVSKDKRIVVSCAGRTLHEIEAILKAIPDHQLNILHCVAEYPCRPENLRLGNIPILIKQFGCDRVNIGYSGHEEGIYPSLAAVSLGAKMVERHFCLSRRSFVHHIECSLEPKEFLQMVAIANHGVPDHLVLEQIWKPHLPPIALDSVFGMTKQEKSFLEGNVYGNDYLKDGSKIK